METKSHEHHPRRCDSPRHSSSTRLGPACLLAGVLFGSLPRATAVEASVDYKYEDYAETGDRIRVKAHYARAELGLGTSTHVSVRGVIDTITGASPTGQPAPEGSDEVPLGNLEDIRRAGIADLTYLFGPNTVRLEYAHSREDDYISNGYALSYKRSVNERNTDLQFGVSFNDDKIQPFFFTEARQKRSYDYLIGVTQLLGPNTTLTANFSYGTSEGYLSDPYKIVQKTVELLPGVELPLTFPENRPTHRNKQVAFVELSHFFENLRGSAEPSLRLYHDSHGIDSVTLDFAWYQRIGERFVVRPNVRYYRQSAADYYHYNLDSTSIEPVDEPVGTAPHYSSDYRLSKLDATTLGLKLIYLIDGSWSVDAAYERYDMRGRDGITPRSAYATANILTVGFRLWF